MMLNWMQIRQAISILDCCLTVSRLGIVGSAQNTNIFRLTKPRL
jgi:hypothetical protein